MALIHIDHVPETVRVNLPLNIILPEPGKMGEAPVAERKVLYLLHGLSDDASAWQRYTMIEPVAALYGLVVVMPSVERSFYTDLPNGQLYFTYLTEELPRYLEKVFGISPRRENTLIAGNSMGGYGAFKAAFLHPELYSVAGSFSGVLSFAFLALYPDDPRRGEFEYMFGSVDRLIGSENDPEAWLKQRSQNPGVLPHLFMVCGRQDDLFRVNQQFYTACQTYGIAVEYREEDGFHDWFFWNQQIQRFLAAYLEPV